MRDRVRICRIYDTLWRLVRKCVTQAVLVFLLPNSVAMIGSTQKRGTNTTSTLQQRERFQASTTLLDKSGKPRTVRITVHDWIILGDQRIAAFPEHGFLLLQLTGGKATTTIADKAVKRHHGEFWVVSNHAKMSLEVTCETGSLEVTNFSIR